MNIFTKNGSSRREEALASGRQDARELDLSLVAPAATALQYVRILAGREDFGARAVPARSTPARSKMPGFPDDLLMASPLRPGTGRAPLRLRRAARSAVTRHASPVTVHAFSLIEILVVIALLSVIILGLLAMFNQTQRAFRTGMTQVDVLEAGRAATEMIARELSQISPAKDTRDAVTFNAAIYDRMPSFFLQPQSIAPLLQPLPGSNNPPERRMNVLEGLFFLTQENQTGQPRWSGIGYWVGDPDTGASPTGGWGTLYRFQTNTVFQRMPSPASLYSYYYFPNTRSNLSSPIIDGVVHFKVRAYDTNGYWITNNLPANTDIRDIRNSTIVPGEVEFYCFTNNAVPAFVEFELGILEERTLKRLQSIPAAARRQFLEDPERGLAGRVHLFRMRVPVRNVDPTAYQ